MLKSTIVTLLFAVSQCSEEIPSVTILEYDPELSKIKNAYFRFVAEYGKQYATKTHMDERFEIFKDNYSKIEMHNNHIDEEGRSPPFTMGINEFSDLTEEEFMAERLGGAQVPKRLKEKRMLKTGKFL